MAEAVIIPYAPRGLQQTLHDSFKRWNVVVCHRRFGKTVMCINHQLRAALTCTKERPRFAYLAPTYKQAKTIAWDYLQHYSRVIPGIDVNQAELRIDYPNGARIQLFGCDNPDALRGIYLDGCILDEYAQMPSSLFSEVLRPALSDREGWAIFIGTPKGRNAFYELFHKAEQHPDWFTVVYKASESKILPETELVDARAIMSEDEYEQEYECSWSASIKGAYYAKEMHAAESSGRIAFVPIDPMLEVYTFWDLGIADRMTIWFVQAIGNEIRCINYYEHNGEGMAHYIQYLNQFAKSNNIKYAAHYAPHDIEVRELSTGKTRRRTAQDMGLNFFVVKQHKVMDGIEASRRLLPKIWFDKERCSQGVECMRNYRTEWDDKKGVFKDNPLHDWASHGADAFRQMAMAWQDRFSLQGSQPVAPVQMNTEWGVF